MAPFPCPNCGTSVLVDKITKDLSTGDEVITVESSFDLDAPPMPESLFEPRGFNYRGRYQLISEILKLRGKVRRLEEAAVPRRPWFGRWFW